MKRDFLFEDSVSEDKCGIIIYEGKGAFYFSVFACFLFGEVDMACTGGDLFFLLNICLVSKTISCIDHVVWLRKECYGSI